MAMHEEELRLRQSGNPRGEALASNPFLEGQVRQEVITIGGRDKNDLMKEIMGRGVMVNRFTASIVNNPKFTTLPEPTEIGLVLVKAGALVPKPEGKGPTFLEIFVGAKLLGLDIVPAETALYYRLVHMDQQVGESVVMGMNPITDSEGIPGVLEVEHDNDEGLLFEGNWKPSDSEWSPEEIFAFRSTK